MHRLLIRYKMAKVKAVVSGCVKVEWLKRCSYVPNSPKVFTFLTATLPHVPGVFQRLLKERKRVCFWQRSPQFALVWWEETGNPCAKGVLSIFKIKDQVPSLGLVNTIKDAQKDRYKELIPQRLALSNQSVDQEKINKTNLSGFDKVTASPFGFLLQPQ